MLQLAWAPGKGMKDKQWKDYWDVELGVSYIPINKLDPQVNMAELEEGGTFDEDTMPEWMKTMRGVAPATAVQNNVVTAPQFIPVPEGIPPPPTAMEQTPQPAFIGMPPPSLTNMPPPNLLLPPRFPPTALPGGFDASLPPPGLRLPFPPPPPINSGGGPEDMDIDSNAGNRNRDSDGIGNRLRNLANDGQPRSLLDMPDCPKPDGFNSDMNGKGFYYLYYLFILERELLFFR